MKGLGRENRRFYKAVADMHHTVHRLEEMEQTLDVLTRTESLSVATFEAQLQRNLDLLRDMPSSRQAEVLQLLLPWALRQEDRESATLEAHGVGDLVTSWASTGWTSRNGRSWRPSRGLGAPRAAPWSSFDA